MRKERRKKKNFNGEGEGGVYGRLQWWFQSRNHLLSSPLSLFLTYTELSKGGREALCTPGARDETKGSLG